MSYTYLQEQGGVSSVASFSDIPAYVLSRLNLAQAAGCFKGSVTESLINSPCGTMCEPLTGLLGEGRLMSFVEASRVRTLAVPVKGLGLKEQEVDFGEKCLEWYAKLDPDTSLWKTRQCSLLEGLGEFSETWPRWGMMQGGVCWEVSTSVVECEESEYGYLPAAMAADGTTAGGLDRLINGRYWNLRDWYHQVMRGTDGTPARRRNARFWEWLMGWPDNWTGSKPLAMDKFQSWLQEHSDF